MSILVMGLLRLPLRLRGDLDLESCRLAFSFVILTLLLRLLRECCQLILLLWYDIFLVEYVFQSSALVR